jgi:hypothetical protein
VRFFFGHRKELGKEGGGVSYLYLSLLHTIKRLHYRGEGGSVKVKRIIFYLAKNLPTPLYTLLFLSLVCLAPPSLAYPFPTSVADSGCLYRISDPDFYPSRITDLGSRIQKQQQKREVKKN